jgi:hypothetical protein
VIRVPSAKSASRFASTSPGCLIADDPVPCLIKFVDTAASVGA